MPARGFWRLNGLTVRQMCGITRPAHPAQPPEWKGVGGYIDTCIKQSVPSTRFRRPWNGPERGHRPRAPPLLPSLCCTRPVARTGLHRRSQAGFGADGRIWVCIAGGARWSAGALKLSWRSQIRIRARLDRRGSVQGKAVAAGHAPHPVVGGTRTPHILPAVRMRNCAK